MLFGTEGAELAALEWLHRIFECGFCDGLMRFVSLLGEYGFVWILIAVVMLCTKKYRRCGVFLAAALTVSLFVGVLGIKNLVQRPRPFEVNPALVPQIPKPTDFSFPSGHTLTAFVSALVILSFDRRVGAAALVLAVLIALSRMYLYVHFPTDILGGIFLALVIFAVLCPFFVEKRKVKAKK